MLNKCIYFVLFLKVFAICASNSIDFQKARDQFMFEIDRTCQGPTFTAIFAKRDFSGALLISLDETALKECPVLKEANLHANNIERCMAAASFAVISDHRLSYDQKIASIARSKEFCRRFAAD